MTGGMALFLALLVLLSWQVRAGRDPKLSAQQSVAQIAAKPQRVLVRRIVRKVIDERVVLIHPAPAASQPVAAPAGSAPSSSTVVQAAAPVAAAAPAPAPAPAPVVTRTS